MFKEESDVLGIDLVEMAAIHDSRVVLKSIVLAGILAVTVRGNVPVYRADSFCVIAVSEEQEESVGGFVGGVRNHIVKKRYDLVGTLDSAAVNLLIDRCHDEELHDRSGLHWLITNDQCLPG